MKTTVSLILSEREYEALKFRAAQLLLSKTHDSIEKMARMCLVEFLELEGRIVKAAVIEELMAEVETPPDNKPQVVVGKVSPTTSGQAQMAEVRQAQRVKARATLLPPSEMRGDQVTAPWKVFCWMARVFLNSKVSPTFDINNAAIGAQVNVKTTYSAIGTLKDMGWINAAPPRPRSEVHGQQVNMYTVSEAGKMWYKDVNNQKWLIERQIISEVVSDTL